MRCACTVRCSSSEELNKTTVLRYLYDCSYLPTSNAPSALLSRVLSARHLQRRVENRRGNRTCFVSFFSFPFFSPFFPDRKTDICFFDIYFRNILLVVFVTACVFFFFCLGTRHMKPTEIAYYPVFNYPKKCSISV